MKNRHKNIWVATAAVLMATAVWAKLPPTSDEAKAKAAEAAAKTAWSGKVEAYKLCKTQDRVAAQYKKTKLTAASTCVDPGTFVDASVVAAAPAAGSSATAAPAKKP